MSRRWRQQENVIGEISLIGSEREWQQENGNISDIEKQFGGQDDGVDWINKILDPKGAFMFKWHAMFLLSYVITVLCVDPLFLYLPMINQNSKCLTLDKKLMVAALFFRSVFDMIYVGNIILGHFSSRQGRTGIVDPYHQQPRQIIKRYLRSYFAIDILAILPIPQVLVPIIFLKVTKSRFLNLRKLLNLLLFLQYVPRVLRIYLSWRKHMKTLKSSKFARSVWIKVAFNVFLYILASNVLGALWYFFSIQRETACWDVAYKNHNRAIPSSFECGHLGDDHIFILLDACSIQTPNTTLFDFGIFLEAIKSGAVSSTNISQKIMYCFWWGLRNLSSLGQNLQTSTYFWENCFAVFILIYGLLLVLYFIGNAQAYMQMAAEKAAKKAAEKLEEIEAKKLEEIERKMGLIKTKIESWMGTNQLPDNMKEPIITCIRHRLEENKDFDMKKPISYISKDLMTKIRHHLCLPLLKNVPSLENHDENLAEQICESFKPKYYNEDSYIIREGEPLMMLIITQGSACCFKSSNGENSKGIDSDTQYIEKGDLYGEELLEWGFNCSSSRKKWIPASNKTIKTHSKVEAFALTAKDLKHLVAMHSTRAASVAKGFAQELAFRHLTVDLTEEKNKNSPIMENPRPYCRSQSLKLPQAHRPQPHTVQK
ncbi:cyclic nucleotide-gated ion channel 1-like isoform X1 [Alnus glutinosa]|uniref:cyclic nucleotide-gated ion channel 1-like isoform X1 n=1 Tax=Alnus glutinosa TaxID=3517 RepID=UPI002D79B1E3|nr:cyclic nucleotide-gated ion channel 1-like isoform X1 [Alnus glutinosa]